MKYIKIIAFFSCFLYINHGFTQEFGKIPDSLKKYRYEELRNIIFAKSSKKHERIIYSKVILLKAKKENNIDEVISGLNWMAYESDNVELNLKYLDSAISLAKNNKIQYLSDLYFQKGNLFFNQKKLKQALDNYLIANHYPNQSIELENKINFYIATIKTTQGEYQEAIVIIKKCEEKARVHNLPDYPLYLLTLAENYNRIDQIIIADKYVHEGIAICKEKSNCNYLPYFISNRGKNYYKLHQYNKALGDLTGQLIAIKANDDYSNYAENSFFIAECYRKSYQYDKAIVFYKKVDSIFNVKKDIYPILMPSYQNLIDYYKNKNDYKQVIHYSDQFIKADKVIDENYKYITSKIAKSYDIQKIVASKQATISALSNDKTRAIIVTLVFLMLFATSSIFYYKNTKRKQKELEQQKLLFEDYKEKEERIKKEKELEKFQISENSKVHKVNDLDERVIAYLLDCFEKFEKDKLYLDKDCTLQSLSTLWNTNNNYLSRVLNDIKNVSFTQYVNTLRIEFIIEKIKNEKFFIDYSMVALSDFSGFKTVITFARAFKEHTKMNPSDFINQLKNKNLKK